jgi:hypothetical protein
MNRKVERSHVWAREPNDWYVEERWCSEALFRSLDFDGLIVDPFCGLGRILDSAKAAGYATFGMDIINRGCAHDFELVDFDHDFSGIVRALAPRIARFRDRFCIVSNPPYLDMPKGRAIERVGQLNALGASKVALLLRAAWANGGKVSAALETMPLRRVAACSPRPSIPPGHVVLAAESGARYTDTDDKVSVGGGREDYNWYFFVRGHTGKPDFSWVRKPVIAKARPA